MAELEREEPAAGERRWNSLVEMFFEQAARHGSQPLLWAKTGDKYAALSWRDAAERVARLAEALKAQGIRAGDRVILVSENRPEWCISDLAIMAAGAITVPAYTTYTERDFRYIVENSGARGAIVSSAALAREFLPAAHDSDRLRFAIVMEQPKLGQRLNVELLAWDEALAAQPGDVAAFRAGAAGFSRDDTACIIYTSGTGGAPKGVMIHHGGILHNCEGAAEVVAELGGRRHRFLSFLPLSHAYEHVGGQYLPLFLNAEIFYAESLDKLLANLAEARPTIMTAMPRLFEVFRSRILRAIEKQGGRSAALFERALELGLRRVRGESLDARERIEDRLLGLLVRRKVRGRFGGRVQAFISGGAPLNPDVGAFFSALGLLLLQGYGQTETSPVISVNRPARPRTDTVGPPLKNTGVRIAEDGEIMVKGELVMKGYWRDSLATERAFDSEGWLHTGDIGRFDDDGHLMITDRKKDIIVNDKGDNLSPQRIEGMLTLEPEISQAMVYGDRRPHAVALLVPDAEWLADWARANGKPKTLDELKDDKELRAALNAAVKRVNEELAVHERVRRFTLADAPFSIENAQMTPTLKVRRHEVIRLYEERLEAMY